MSLILNCQSISKSFGPTPLFENLSFTISDGDRLGLIGPNGSGKSTFLQILAGIQEPDNGTVAIRKLTRLGYIPQDSVFEPGVTVRRVLLAALESGHLEELEIGARIAETLGKTGFPDADAEAASLSGGWRKRLAIARELIQHPDILLLDEPTNHLDLEGILWLEKLLKNAPFACVLVSHDRYFLENVSTETAELSRAYPDGMFRVNGSYSEFLIKKADFLVVQTKLQESLANKVRGEVEWLRRGAKARTSKSKARIDAAGRLMGELAEVSARNQTGATQIDFTATDRKSKKLIELRQVSKQMGGRELFRDLSLTLSPGRRLGLVGANGSGKTTLLRMLRGEIAPDSGAIERADGLRMVYFDQNRDQLDPNVTLRRALVEHGDSVIYRDRVVHVVSWAKRFLFRAEQLELPVSRLSGGEKARVLIARLMLQTADVLLLDEPTNDLDIPTLEVLEESLTEFPGALVLITHDRYMLDRVSTFVVGLDGQGGSEVFADYSQWEQALQQQSRKSVKAAKEAAPTPPAPFQPKKRLSYKENREWDGIEERIAAAEGDLEARKAAMHSPEIVTDARRLHEAYEALQAAQQAVDDLYARWGELEMKLQPS